MNFQQIRTLNRLAEENEQLKAAIADLKARIETLEQKPKRGRPRKHGTD